MASRFQQFFGAACCALVIGYAGAASASAIVQPVGTAIATVTVTGTYASLPQNAPSPNPFIGSNFTFTVTLPQTLEVTWINGNQANSNSQYAGTYLDTGNAGSFPATGTALALSNVVANFFNSLDVDGVTGQAFGFTVDPFSQGGTDQFTIDFATTGQFGSGVSSGTSGYVTLNAGSYSIDGTNVGGSASYTADSPADPSFTGTLTVGVGVPEPASAALFGVAILGLLGVTRRRVTPF